MTERKASNGAVPKVSIIVAAYNIEKYIGSCLNSLISQTLQDIEIVVVNDGSTDSTLQIIQRYADSDSRILVISQENQGLSAARNTGLTRVSGTYVMFVDGDDLLVSFAAEKLLSQAEKYDLEITLFLTKLIAADTEKTVKDIYYEAPHIPEAMAQDTFSYNDISQFLFDMQVSAWNKLFNVAFLRSLGVEFLVGLCFEDNPFFFETILSATRMAFVLEPLYIYRVGRPNSILTNNRTRKYFDIFPIMEMCKAILWEKNQWENLKHSYWNYAMKSIFYWDSIIHRVHRAEYRQKIKEFMEKDHESYVLALLEPERW